MDSENEKQSKRRGGERPNAGRPVTTLVIKLPKDYMTILREWALQMGTPPDVVAANLVMAHLEAKKRPFPTPEQAKLN